MSNELNLDHLPIVVEGVAKISSISIDNSGEIVGTFQRDGRTLLIALMYDSQLIVFDKEGEKEGDRVYHRIVAQTDLPI